MYFQNDTLKKTIIATEVVSTQLLSYNVVSKHKNKNKNTEYDGMLIHSKVTSTQNKGVPFFSCLGHGV